MKMRYFLLFFILIGAVSAEEFVFGIYPAGEQEVMYHAFAPFIASLSEATGDDYKLIVAADYDDLYERLDSGDLDVVWINPNGYVRMSAAISGLQYLTTFSQYTGGGEEITSFYTSVILSHKQSGLDELMDLEGKRFAFTHKSSTSGYAVPFRIFQEMGIDPEAWFSKVFFLGKHDRVIEALDAGAVDAGVVWDIAWAKAVRLGGNRFYVLLQSDPIPLDPIIAVEGFPNESLEKIRTILNEMPPDHPALKILRDELGWTIAGFNSYSDSFYDPLRHVILGDDQE